MTHNQKSQLEFTQMFPIYEKHARDVKPRAVLIPEKELAAHSTAVHECLDFMCAWSDVLACLRARLRLVKYLQMATELFGWCTIVRRLIGTVGDASQTSSVCSC